MKIAVRYQSRNGNTKAVAEAIAKKAGVTAEPISEPLNEPVDILFIGGGVYAFDIDRSLKAFIEGLNPDLVKMAAAFTTGAGMGKTGAIASAVKNKGIKVYEESLPIKMGIRNYAGLGGKEMVTLSDKTINAIDIFVEKLMSETENKTGD
jgi:flavodoxin